MNIYILNGFTEYSKCYELSSFGDAFLHFQDAKDEAEKKINHILQEFDVDKESEMEVTEDEESFFVSIFSEGNIRLEISIFKKELPVT
ncbi:hypothetical protein [Heyndrickxia sporothermodurans]|uniref:Uncharacterized protein n=1 Tax=Heyndrickxia sporothermodurans TaxID=46224 RepID=A0AB37HKN6_9BACI|nr:hypothetical protein [Heyndrickxia sporothermodurans]MBL5768444.1 hypothetical protein [Heyndrickxia sporothermodurans]MBL5772077.1 hypothetical protein [Heyndrickxia sporothermodurans]MBL5780141.1 hypothetical protein [Heyndrickxia sporothermodurans]MBL5786335.1 hypothetical protein [Heyndrickxia sporothermodurans]MBL5790129.1 hypothetical protein [Heyndrickxia sporothermodurans]